MKNILSVIVLVGLGALVYSQYQKAKKETEKIKVK